jgi:hypothetical protein
MSDIATGMAPRKYDLYDAELVLRAAAAAAITTVGGDYAAPDYESAAIDFGAGQAAGRVLIENLVATFHADSHAHVAVVGVNAAGNAQCELAALRLGPAANTTNTAATATGQKDVDILFTNVKYGQIGPKVKLVVVTDGTSISLDFTARLTRLGTHNAV